MEKLEFGELGSAGSGDDSGLGGSISGLTGSATGGEGGSGSAMSNALSPGDSRKQSIQRCMQSLVHACNCRDANCRMQSCMRLKRIVGHSKNCKKRQVGQNQCAICRQLIALCCYHSKTCEDTQNKCNVPFCGNIKSRLKQQQLQARMRQHQLMQSRIRSMTNAVNASAAPSVVVPAQVSPAASLPNPPQPKPILPSSQQASLNAAANNMSPGPNMALTSTGITSGAGMGKPGSTSMNHVHANNCCDSPSPLQTPTQNESMHYIKQHGGQTNMPARPTLVQQTLGPQQRIIPRHPMASQRSQLQQVGQAGIVSRPTLMQQPMTGQRMISYQMGSQGQQMAPQPQQVPQQQQQQQQIGWQTFPNQHNNMMHANMGQQQGFIPQQQQQQMNQMGNPQHMMRANIPMGNMRTPSMIRPVVGVSRVTTARYGHMNMGHVINDQDMLAYPNQGNYVNRNQQNQQELTPQEKLSHLTDKL